MYIPVFAGKHIAITAVSDLSQWDSGLPEESVLPAFRKAGVKPTVVSRVFYGGLTKKPGLALSRERTVYRLYPQASFAGSGSDGTGR